MMLGDTLSVTLICMESSSSVLVFNKYSLETKTSQLWTTQGYFLRHDLIQESWEGIPHGPAFEFWYPLLPIMCFGNNSKRKKRRKCPLLLLPPAGAAYTVNHLNCKKNPNYFLYNVIDAFYICLNLFKLWKNDNNKPSTLFNHRTNHGLDSMREWHCYSIFNIIIK